MQTITQTNTPVMSDVANLRQKAQAKQQKKHHAPGQCTSFSSTPLPVIRGLRRGPKNSVPKTPQQTQQTISPLSPHSLTSITSLSPSITSLSLSPTPTIHQHLRYTNTL